MREPHRLFDQAAALQSEGLPQAGIARSQGVHASTVSRWLEKAGKHASAFEQEHLEVDDPVEVQLDELKAYGAGPNDRTWVHSGLEAPWPRGPAGERTSGELRVLRRSREHGELNRVGE